jgi:hypothetical protein
MEQARRPADEDHVHRTPPIGASVMIAARSWQTYPNAFEWNFRLLFPRQLLSSALLGRPGMDFALAIATGLNREQDVMKENSLAFRPVGLTMHCIAEYRVVHSVRRAPETLRQRWSIDDGEDLSEAVMVCLEGLHNRAPLENVRAAFIKAAHDAIDADNCLARQ